MASQLARTSTIFKILRNPTATSVCHLSSRSFCMSYRKISTSLPASPAPKSSDALSNSIQVETTGTHLDILGSPLNLTAIETDLTESLNKLTVLFEECDPEWPVGITGEHLPVLHGAIGNPMEQALRI